MKYSSSKKIEARLKGEVDPDSIETLLHRTQAKFTAGVGSVNLKG
jgi:hypothetical protein